MLQINTHTGVTGGGHQAAHLGSLQAFSHALSMQMYVLYLSRSMVMTVPEYVLPWNSRIFVAQENGVGITIFGWCSAWILPPQSHRLWTSRVDIPNSCAPQSFLAIS